MAEPDVNAREDVTGRADDGEQPDDAGRGGRPTAPIQPTGGAPS